MKVLDFGLARRASIDGMTAYVTTPFYRAPEVLLGATYDEKIDVWSVGCVMAEMIYRRVLFEGENRIDQINQIIGMHHYHLTSQY